MRRFLLSLLLLLTMFSCVACNNNFPQTNMQTSVDNSADEQAKKEAEEKAKREAEEKARLEAEEKARKEAEEKAISEAQVVVEDFMDEFLVLNLKGMVEYTDAEVDYSEMTYLSLDEYKREMLSEFRVFEAMGLPLDGFSGIVDTVFASYEKYSSYKITSAEMQGEDVVFNVKAEYIKAETMENIINTAINKVNTEELEMKVAGSLVVGGLTSGSIKGAVQSVLTPIVESLDLAVTRSIEELSPEKGTLKFVVSKIDDEWVIRDQLSDFTMLSKIFERTTQE